MKHEEFELGLLQIRCNTYLDILSAELVFDLVRATTWYMNHVGSLLVIYAYLTHFNCLCFLLKRGRRDACIGFWCGNLRERDHWGDSGVDGRIILGWIFRKWDVGCGLDWAGSG
jgi:hypothetical protein